MTSEAKIILIDDNAGSRHDLQVILGFLGERVVAASGDEWHARIHELAGNAAEFSVAIIGECSHLPLDELLGDLYRWDAGLPFVLIGAASQSRLPEAVLRNNIIATVSYPLTYQPLLDALHKAQVFREHFHRLQDIGGIRDFNMFRSLVGNSPSIQRIRQMMGQVADKEVSVLITGESGTGKEVVARNLHLNSARADKPFIPINCGAIPRELLESELFGHEKGAFTGAVSSRAGRFELAEGGTLFLDEIGDMPPGMQVKLLRVLQEHSFERVGGARTIHTDVRILAATHRNLEQMIAAGEFRQDLYYRLNVFPIEMPSLRQRSEDIPLLLNELISIMESEQRGSVRFNSAAIACLCRYSWPGNVRELANLVERMAILHPSGIVGVKDLPEVFHHLVAETDVADLPPALAGLESGRDNEFLPSLPLQGLDLKEYLANLEKDLIDKALQDCGGVVARAAERLNIRRTTLVEKMRKYEMQRRGEAGEEEADDSATADAENVVDDNLRATR